MHITNLKIQNFKSIKDLELKLSRINVLVGEPNSGKSNILESLGLFSAVNYNSYSSMNSRMKGYISTEFVRYFYPFNLFYNNDVASEVIISLNNNIEMKIKIVDNEYTFSINITQEINKKNTKTSYSFSNIKEIYSLKLNHKGQHLSKKTTEELEELELLKRIKFYRFRSLEQYPDKNPGYLLPPIGSNLTTLLQTNNKLRAMLANVLRPFDLEINLRLEEESIELIKKIPYATVSFPLKLTAETIQRIFFIMSIIVSNNNSFIVLEEPETHMFPYYTKYIAETIVQSLTNGNQYLISTHNPYFLITLLEKSKKEDIATFIVNYSKGETKARKLHNEEVCELLDLEIDPFFNLERYY